MARKFIRGTRAWWAASNDVGPGMGREEEFILSQPADGGYPQIELVVQWTDFTKSVGTGGCPARVSIFNESWQAFVLWTDLWLAMAQMSAAGGDGWECTPDEFEATLARIGFEDITPTENPYLRREHR